jgi:hypothetical protein
MPLNACLFLFFHPALSKNAKSESVNETHKRILASLLTPCRAFQSTDPLDNFFDILGLLSKSDPTYALIQPDYEIAA